MAVAVPSLTYEGVPLDDELGGGLNNLIMNLAQILHDACSRHAVLVLPHITSGWRFFPASNHSRQTLEFSDVFDSSYFIEQVQPCAAVTTAPPGAVFRRSKVVGINNKWPYDHALPRVYKALRPSARMRGVVERLVASASELAGPSWSGVHLRIERDWWEVSPFCNRKRYPTQRCFIPSEVAALIDAHRHRLRSSGSVLFYASENIPRRGPRVNFSPFGPRTAKVQIPNGLPYTLRATAEFFLAARSPAGFYGNSFSTFSRGVALLRRMQGGTDASSHGQRSFAYDCGAALRETPSSAGGIRYLDTLNRSRCFSDVPRSLHTLASKGQRKTKNDVGEVLVSCRMFELANVHRSSSKLIAALLLLASGHMPPRLLESVRGHTSSDTT